MAISQDQQALAESRIQDLSEAKRRLLQQRMQGMASLMESDNIRSRPAGARVPLSVEQRRVWLHASQQPDVPIYNEPFTILRYGSFDLGLLEESINEILRRHEIWRTSFSQEGEQVVHPNVHVSLPLVDLSDLPPAEREAEALRIATEDARTPIPLDAVPLFRAHVMRMKADEHRLYLTLHHIIFDAISISRIFVPELSAIYACFEQRKSSSLASLELQYGDYAMWREQDMDSPEAQQHLAYWLEQLSGELPVLCLPEDRPRPAIMSYRGSMECFQVPADLVENLRHLSCLQGVTLFMTLLTAFKVLLFRYSGQNDLIVGSPSDSRRRPELEGVMGYFVDTFAIRTRPDAGMRFSEYLSQTRDSILGGLAAADVPFDRVVRELNPKRDAARHPVFQTFFSIRPPMPYFPVGWNLNQMDVTVGTTKFELYLELCERPEQMEARFFYSTDIWDATTIRRMADHWQVLLQSVCQNPESTLGTLPLLTPEETANLLGSGGWNDTSRAFPPATVNQLIEDQAGRTPHKIAATFGGLSWTYEELNCRAEAHASLLKAVGVAAGSIVAIWLDRSLDMLAALIAVLKTGAAYLPLDIQMPRERIALFFADAQPSAIVTQRCLVEQVATGTRTIVLVDGDCENCDSVLADTFPTEPAQVANDPEDTAYLIYTSGTTGEPKAVEVSHRSLVNLLVSMQSAPGFSSEDVFLAVTPISFDIAALELLLPLICGGTAAIANSEEAQDPYLLADAISRSGCTVMQTTPARWRTLVLSGWDNARQSSAGNALRLRRILCGGEVLSRELANRLLATGAEIWNMYGPTETAIWSLIHRVQPERDQETSQIAVGKPIANTTAFILDAQQQPLPIGVPGELFLGGVGLAIGYRGQPQKTADRFIQVGSVGGVRLYRTGDVAVRRADGTIEVLGRTDNQVKVRGHRIELEAVEAAVLRHPRVVTAAARVWQEASGDMRLGVYVVSPNDARAPSLADIREFLRDSLPESMIPSEVIPLPAIPLTRHGKVDRARLPLPTANGTVPLQSRQSLRDEVRLAAIWAELLGRNHIGLDDDFFDLGGHSLLVAALQRRIVNEIGKSIPIVKFFQNPTIRQQSELTSGLVKEAQVLPPGVHALQPFGTRKSIFWVHYLSVNLAEAIGEDQPFLSVGLTAEDISLLRETPTLQNIAACLLRKILVMQGEGPYTIGGLCVGGILAFEIASQLRVAGREVSLLILLDPPSPSCLDLNGSLIRRFSYLRYLMKRTVRLGPRVSLIYLRDRLLKLLPGSLRARVARRGTHMSQGMIETAASRYKPAIYEGKVLLLLASEHRPDVNFLPGWLELVPRSLHVQSVDGHHTDLLNATTVRRVADAIMSHLVPYERSS